MVKLKKKTIMIKIQQMSLKIRFICLILVKKISIKDNF